MQFTAATILVLVIDETNALRRVLNELQKYFGKGIEEIIIVVCDRTTPESFEICQEYEKSCSGKLRILRQLQPGMGMAIREGIQCVRTSHVGVVYADGESDPATVPALIEKAKEHPKAIISASRWLQAGLFENGGKVKRLLNLLAQRLTAFVYASDLTDFTFGYRLYPTTLVQQIPWEQSTHGFSYESILRPLRMGIQIIEVPSRWRLRDEGKSSWPLYAYWRYGWILLKFSRFWFLSKSNGALLQAVDSRGLAQESSLL